MCFLLCSIYFVHLEISTWAVACTNTFKPTYYVTETCGPILRLCFVQMAGWSQIPCWLPFGTPQGWRKINLLEIVVFLPDLVVKLQHEPWTTTRRYRAFWWECTTKQNSCRNTRWRPLHFKKKSAGVRIFLSLITSWLELTNSILSKNQKQKNTSGQFISGSSVK